jgi:cyclase
LKGKGLHKTVKFSNGKYLGDAINVVRLFNDKQCDELVLLNTEASRKKNELDLDFLKEIAAECFMPLTYGGGVHSLQQIEGLLKLGIEKISLNSTYIQNPKLVKDAIQSFGCSTIVVSIDIRKNFFGKYKVYDHVQGKVLNEDIYQLFDDLNTLEPGEVLINSVDLDGTQKGYDLNLAKKAGDALRMPVVFVGGCRGFQDIHRLLNSTQVSAAGVGSYFVFHGPHKGVLISYPLPKEIESIYSQMV